MWKNKGSMPLKEALWYHIHGWLTAWLHKNSKFEYKNYELLDLGFARFCLNKGR